MRSDMEFSALKDRTLPYVQLASGEIRNAYTIKVVNKQLTTRDMVLSVEGLAGARIEVIGEGEEATSVRLTVQSDGVDRYRLLITAPANQVSGGDITLVLADPASDKRVAVSTPFAGPER
jgi:polyferredoxin